MSFAEDIIIFTSTTRYLLKLIMKSKTNYEAVLDRLLKKYTSMFMVTTNSVVDSIEIIKEEIVFNKKERPITYLGCPLYIWRQNLIYYYDLVDKVIKRTLTLTQNHKP